MGLLDTLLGRTKPVKANLDQLFSLSGAAITLEAATGLVPSGRAGVCAKPPTGPSFAQMQRDIDALLATGSSDPSGNPTPSTSTALAGTPGVPDDDASGLASGADLTVRHVTDSYGYSWLVVDGGTIEDLVTRVHMVHSSLEDAGWSTQILCSVFGFRPGPEPGPDPIGRTLFLVYLAKRGSFYPFAPTGPQQRDSEMELRVRSVLGSDLPIESDLSRWFPMWGLPVA